MPFAKADDGTRISYESHGTGSLKVLLLHGWGGSSSYWRDLVSHLNLEGLHLIAPSYRGHGDSDKPSAGYTLDQFAKNVVAVADAEGVRRFVLVGFSMSGKFAQYVVTVEQFVLSGWTPSNTTSGCCPASNRNATSSSATPN